MVVNINRQATILRILKLIEEEEAANEEVMIAIAQIAAQEMID